MVLCPMAARESRTRPGNYREAEHRHDAPLFYTPFFLLDACCSRFGNHAKPPQVRIIARRTLLRFVESLKGREGQKAVKAALDAWFHEVPRAAWRSPTALKRSYGIASIVGADRVVFNIKGNDYRLVAAIDYRRQIVFIKWLGPHGDYDKTDARTIQHGD